MPAFVDAGRSMRPSRGQGRVPLGLIAICVFAAVVRLYSALDVSFDQDELYTLMESRELFASSHPTGINARPLFYLLTRGLLEIGSPSPLLLRALPLIFGVLGVWVTWHLAARFLNRNGAAVASLIVAISPWHMYASSTARYYSLVYLCTALALLWILDAYKSDAPRYYAGALAAMIVGTLTHPSFIITFAGPVLGLTIVDSDGRIRWKWPSKTAWKFLWVPYAAFVAAGLATLFAVGRASGLANGADRGLSATLRLLPAIVDWMTVPVFAAAIAGAILMTRARSELRRVGVMTLLAVAVTFCSLFVASLMTSAYADYAIGVLPLMFLAVGAAIYGLDGVETRAPMSAARVTSGIVLLAASLPSVVSYLSDGLRFDYREAFRRIETRGPAIATVSAPIVQQRHYAPSLRGYELRADSAYLQQILDRERDVWAVISVKRHGLLYDANDVVANWIINHCRRVDVIERPRFDYRVYRLELHRCVGPVQTKGD